MVTEGVELRAKGSDAGVFVGAYLVSHNIL